MTTNITSPSCNHAEGTVTVKVPQKIESESNEDHEFKSQCRSHILGRHKDRIRLIEVTLSGLGPLTTMRVLQVALLRARRKLNKSKSQRPYSSSSSEGSLLETTISES